MTLDADHKSFVQAHTRMRQQLQSATEHIAPNPRSEDSMLKAMVMMQFGYASLRDKGWSPESIQEFVEHWENELQRRGVLKP